MSHDTMVFMGFSFPFRQISHLLYGFGFCVLLISIGFEIKRNPFRRTWMNFTHFLYENE